MSEGKSTHQGRNEPSEASAALIKDGMGAIRWLFLLQIGSRMVTFALNTAIARIVPQGTFAIAHMQLQLLLNIILPLSREAFRRAILRVPLDAKDPSYRMKAEKLLNFSYFSILLSVLVMPLATVIFLKTSTVEELSTPGYQEVILWVAAAAFVEILSEPLYTLANHRLMFGTRAAVELLAIIIKSLISFVMVVIFQAGLVSFGIATFFYCLTVTIGYWVYFGFLRPLPEFPTLKSLLPHRIMVKNEDGKPVLLSWSESTNVNLSQFFAPFQWQTLQKILLHEGEKIVLRGAETLDIQGVYAVVNVLGSLVVRFVFSWLEEGLFPLFSALLVQALAIPERRIGNERNETQSDAATSSSQASTSAKTRKMLLKKAGIILGLLSKLMSYIGLIFACFGPAYAFLLLDLLYTSKYSKTVAPVFLGWYCLYIFIMAVNGITEAFAHSAASPRVLNYLNIAMVAQSVLFVVSALFLLRDGYQAGIIMANCIVMSSRIVLSVGFIRRFFIDNVSRKAFKLSQLFPHPIIVLSFIASFGITKVSESNFCSAEIGFSWIYCGQHVLIGATCLATTLGAALILERSYFVKLQHFIRHKEV